MDTVLRVPGLILRSGITADGSEVTGDIPNNRRLAMSQERQQFNPRKTGQFVKSIPNVEGQKLSLCCRPVSNYQRIGK
jgi:hypothetical protein